MFPEINVSDLWMCVLHLYLIPFLKDYQVWIKQPIMVSFAHDKPSTVTVCGEYLGSLEAVKLIVA